MLISQGQVLAFIIWAALQAAMGFVVPNPLECSSNTPDICPKWFYCDINADECMPCLVCNGEPDASSQCTSPPAQCARNDGRIVVCKELVAEPGVRLSCTHADLVLGTECSVDCPLEGATELQCLWNATIGEALWSRPLPSCVELAAPLQPPSVSQSKGSTTKGAPAGIIGAALGSVAMCLVLGLVLFFILRSRRSTVHQPESPPIRDSDKEERIPLQVIEASPPETISLDDATGAPGRPGATGAPGQPGATGAPGQPGATGAPGQPGATGAPGQPGATSAPGQPGATGAPGQPEDTSAPVVPGAQIPIPGDLEYLSFGIEETEPPGEASGNVTPSPITELKVPETPYSRPYTATDASPYPSTDGDRSARRDLSFPEEGSPSELVSIRGESEETDLKTTVQASPSPTENLDSWDSSGTPSPTQHSCRDDDGVMTGVVVVPGVGGSTDFGPGMPRSTEPPRQPSEHSDLSIEDEWPSSPDRRLLSDSELGRTNFAILQPPPSPSDDSGYIRQDGRPNRMPDQQSCSFND